MSQLHSIQNEDDYEAALNEISIFFDNEPALGSKQSTRFESLLNLIDAYESKNYSINLSNTGPQV